MRADYDPTADTIAIELEQVDHADQGEELAEGVVVHLFDDRPVALDVLDASRLLSRKLAAVSVRYGLDIEALEGVSRNALANPDQVVVLEVLPAT